MLLTYDVWLSNANVMKQTSFFREQTGSTSTHPNTWQTYRWLLILHLQFCNCHIYQKERNKGCERTGFEKGFQGERALKNVMSFEPCRKKQSCNTSPTTPSHEWCNQRLQRSYRDPVVGTNCISISLFFYSDFFIHCTQCVHRLLGKYGKLIFWVKGFHRSASNVNNTQANSHERLTNRTHGII